MSRTLLWKRSAANKYMYCDNCISLTGLFLFYWCVYGNSMCFRAGFRRMCLKHNVSTSASNGWQLDVRFKHKVSIRFSGTDNHRRTGNFCQGGGGGKPFAQKNLARCPNFYERVEKKWGPYCSNIGRPGILRWLDTVFQGQYHVWA